MQTIANLGFLQFAQKSIELLEIAVVIPGERNIQIKPLAARQFEDVGLE